MPRPHALHVRNTPHYHAHRAPARDHLWNTGPRLAADNEMGLRP
ncbi:hypothetical protein KPP03845_200164 (plasmid) [Streptomyces xanthophaeus]|nr:hypothetical protein KPP03845_200164 [Streptomyces xanthophaeus]